MEKAKAAVLSFSKQQKLVPGHLNTLNQSKQSCATIYYPHLITCPSFAASELCEGCIVKEGHPSVSSNPYRALGFGFQKQRQGTSSTFPDHTNTNRPGGPPLRYAFFRRFY